MRVSLHMIVKDEVDNVEKLIDRAKDYVDGIYITVSDKDAYETLKQNDDAAFDYRPWNDKFDDARNHNWKMGANFDASMWIDADDAFDFSKLPKMLPLLNEYDAIFLPYHYDHDENGNVIVSHWRERIVRRDAGFFWRGWVHENLITEKKFTKINVDIPVVHNQVKGHREHSLERNHAILEKAYKETNDPRYIHYLGISFFTMHEYQKAIDILNEYIKVGGWDEEVYRSVIKIAEAYYMMEDVDKAVIEALKASAILPDYPGAFHLLCHFEYTSNNYKEALEWGKVALSKPIPTGGSIHDPTQDDRTKLTMAMANYSLANYTEAYKLLIQVKAIDTAEIEPTFKYDAEAETLSKILPTIYQFYADPTVLWKYLNDDVKYMAEFRKIREQLTKPRIWSDNEIAIFCGKGYEEWGPHTLDKGMGGSEEAIVYLAPQLQKLGYKVTVFGEVSEPFEQDGVQWKPWNYIDRRDEFSTLVVWRMPQFVSQFKAKQMLVDLHDLVPTETVKPYPNTIYLFKSQYHKDKYPQIENYAIIPNGIDVSQFKPTEKKANSVIYPSAYYRGLERLLAMWPKIKEQVPDATLDIYYGWQSWVTMEGEDDFYKRMLVKFKEMKKLGVTEHGRVDHKTLAQKMGESKVWAYPTEFPEIFCITAVKANLAGCKPVITDVAALKETGGPSATMIETDIIYSDQYAQKKFVDAVVKSLKEEHDSTDQTEWAKQFDWSNVAKQWKDVIDG